MLPTVSRARLDPEDHQVTHILTSGLYNLPFHNQEETREVQEARTTQAELGGLTCPLPCRWLVTPSSPGACLVTS